MEFRKYKQNDAKENLGANKTIPYIYIARNIMVSLFAIIILIWAFPKNKFLGRIIILTIPFWLFAICFCKLAFFRKSKQ